MTETTVGSIEDELGVELPDLYRDFLASYPKPLLATPAAGFEVQCDPARIVTMNKQIDENHVEGWRDSFLAIGESGCGDYYAIDLNEDDGEVYFWNHETAEVEEDEGFPSLIEFAGHFLHMYQSQFPEECNGSDRSLRSRWLGKAGSSSD